MSSQPLKTVDEHNAERIEARRKAEEAFCKTGVACPKCGNELRWASTGYMLTMSVSNSTSRYASCQGCKLQVLLEW